MDDEKKIGQRVEQYRELGKEDANVDVGALALFELQQAQRQEEVSAKRRRWAYLLAAGLPPIGLIFAAWYYFSGKPGGKKAALICVIITVVTIAISWLLLRQMMSSLDTTQMEQIKNINLDDYKSLLE
ncbi:MAG TPA: DMT family transporter [Candidatus Baltobacteraceae bacterium]|nr:DMT family transporter [Candidatus Baltobacteraceae bacterium]